MAATASAPKTTKTAKPKAKSTTAKGTTAKPRAARTTKPTPKPAPTPVERVQATAEKAVLVQIGAALIARDAVMDAYKGIAGTDLTAAEKRGKTARTQAEQRARKARTRLTTVAKRNRKRVEHDTATLRKTIDARASRVTSQAESLGAQIETLIIPVRDAGLTVAERVAEAFPTLKF